MRTWILVCLLLGLAGCLTGSGDPAPDTDEVAGPAMVDSEYQVPGADLASPGIQVLATGAGCRGFCEPMVAVGDGGRIFVKGDTYQRSTPEGGWEAFLPPPTPSVPGHNTFQTDRAIAVSQDGQLWFHTLIGGISQVNGQFQYLGVQVAHSRDGGDSWLDATHITLDPQHPSGALGADRQWIGFGASGAYLSYQRNAIAGASAGPAGYRSVDLGNVWISHSADGATWSDFQPVQELDGTSDHATGQMVVRDDGVYIPFSRAPQNGGFVVARSADGTEWTSSPTGTQSNFFPALTDADGTLVAMAQDGQGGLFQIASPDGDSWSTPVFWNAGRTISSPWIGSVNGTLWAAWLERTEGTEDRFDVVMARNATERIEVASALLGTPTSRANTDFVHFDFLHGRPLLVAGDNTDGILRLYWLP